MTQRRPRGAVKIGDRVEEIAYRHADTNYRGVYAHTFGGGDELYGLPDGSLLIRNRDGRRLWNLREVGDDE